MVTHMATNLRIETLWTARDADALPGPIASVLAGESRLYAVGAKRVAALDPRDGRVLWFTEYPHAAGGENVVRRVLHTIHGDAPLAFVREGKAYLAFGATERGGVVFLVDDAELRLTPTPEIELNVRGNDSALWFTDHTEDRHRAVLETLNKLTIDNRQTRELLSASAVIVTEHGLYASLQSHGGDRDAPTGGRVVSIDFDGWQRWTRAFTRAVPRVARAGDALLLLGDSTVEAVDPLTGNTLAEHRRTDHSQIAAAWGELFITHTRDSIAAHRLVR